MRKVGKPKLVEKKLSLFNTMNRRVWITKERLHSEKQKRGSAPRTMKEVLNY
jgi:hypothetical protein